jgi:rhodanese-related sulfurtransferase
LIIAVAACAEAPGPYPDAAFFSKDITIVDIRTEAEWRQTGIIADSKTITFFDENGEYDEADFFRQLDQVIDKNEEFAIICRSGRRTRVASQILIQNGYRVIDIKGGIKHLPAGVDLVPYKP